MAPRETENNADAKFWGDKQRALWYVMVFSGVVNGTYSSAACKSFLLMVMFGIFGPGIILTSLPRDSSLFIDEELRKDCNVLLG